MYPPPHPYPPTPASTARRWWQHPALIIGALIVFPPGGIALAWTSQWSQAKKIIATVLAGLWFLTPFLGDPPKDDKADAKPTTVQSVTASPTPSVSASPTATAAKAPQMPNVVGNSYGDAMEALEKAGINEADVSLDDVYLDIDAPTHSKAAEDGDWRVCFQTPGKGTTVKEATTIRLDLGQWSDADLVQKCPTAKGTTYKIPANDPAYNSDDNTDTSDSGSSSSGSSSSGGSSSDSGGSGSVYYKNCTAVRAAGAAPIHRGDPGYGRHLDRDGDGVACE
ncbi:excalibur calcium-binding domain-containing protein (plasmid) [Streptomyces sp. NBC_01724]|uniref:excalibur calcium-binding domain-containing protein n=1 Tax=Streptomyces sp. NBC_01724 TaxID=2975922 RepID=UPI002E30ECDF|nr:excalibur calcium-binding domain-containing protein [Streptomyces sp. NBC_01724]